MEGKLQADKIHDITLEDADLANRALDAWQDAEKRARDKANKK